MFLAILQDNFKCKSKNLAKMRGKTKKGSRKKMFLAILHDNSRGKSMKKLQQDWKNENDKKKKKVREKVPCGDSPRRF